MYVQYTHTQLCLQPQLCLLAIAQHACARTLGRMGAWARGGVGGRLHTGSRGHGVTDGRTDRSDTARAGSDRLTNYQVLTTSANYVVLRGSRSEYVTEVIGPRLEFGDPVSALQLYDSYMHPATCSSTRQAGDGTHSPRAEREREHVDSPWPLIGVLGAAGAGLYGVADADEA